MAVHYVCDVCGMAIDKSSNGATFEQDNVRVLTRVSIDGVWNGGHICVACVVNTVLNGGVTETSPTFSPYRSPEGPGYRIDKDAGYVEVDETEELPLGGTLIVDDEVRAIREEQKKEADEPSGNYGPDGL